MKTIQEIFSLLIEEELYGYTGNGLHSSAGAECVPYMCFSLDDAHRKGDLISEEERQLAKLEISSYMEELWPESKIYDMPSMRQAFGYAAYLAKVDLTYTPEVGLALYSNWANRPYTGEEVAKFLKENQS